VSSDVAEFVELGQWLSVFLGDSGRVSGHDGWTWTVGWRGCEEGSASDSRVKLIESVTVRDLAFGFQFKTESRKRSEQLHQNLVHSRIARVCVVLNSGNHLAGLGRNSNSTRRFRSSEFLADDRQGICSPSLTSASSGLSMAFSSLRTSNQSALLGFIAFTQYASSAPSLSSPGLRHTTRATRALQRLGSFGDRTRTARCCGPVRSDPNASHLNLGLTSLTTACSASASGARADNSPTWPPDAQAHWRAGLQGFVGVILPVSLAPAGRKAGMAREAMGVGGGTTPERTRRRYPKKDDRFASSVDRICRSNGSYGPT
jgi:hypothetical protein